VPRGQLPLSKRDPLARPPAAQLLGHLAYRCRRVKWRGSLIRTIISLMARFNSLLGRNKFPVPMRREFRHNAFKLLPNFPIL
jgi:hypothetical protein